MRGARLCCSAPAARPGGGNAPPCKPGSSAADPAGQGRCRCRCRCRWREGPATPLTPSRRTGCPGPAAGEGMESPRRACPPGAGAAGRAGVPPPGPPREHLPGQGRQPRHRSARSSSPAASGTAACSSRPCLRAASSHSLVLALASLHRLPPSCAEAATALFSFPFFPPSSTPLADLPHLFNPMALCFPVRPPQLRPSLQGALIPR